MATQLRERGIGRFTPPTAKDFSIRAKNLASLLKTPLQRTQDELAKLYGYSGVHEIQQAIAAAEADPSLAGPYDSEAWSDRIRQQEGISLLNRGNETLYAMARMLGTTLNDAPKPVWDSRDLGLFDEAPRHRIQARRILGKRQVIEAVEIGEVYEEPPQATDYAVISSSGYGETLVHFTEVGKQVYDAIDELSGEKPDVDALEQLRLLHPNNPWTHLAVVQAVAWGNGQAPWATYAPSSLAPEDDSPATLDMMILTKGRSKSILQVAKKSVELFKQIYGKGSKALGNMAPAKLIGIGGQHGGDSEGYPRALYWHALIRANGAHGAKITTKAFKEALKADPRQDTKEAFAMHLFGEGDLEGATKTTKGMHCLPAMLIGLWKAIADQDRDAIAKYLGDAMQTNPWLIDALEYTPAYENVTWGGNKGTRCLMPDGRRLMADEFLWRGGRHTDQTKTVKALLASEPLRQAYQAYWTAKVATYGAGLESREYETRVKAAESDAKTRLKREIEKAVSETAIA